MKRRSFLFLPILGVCFAASSCESAPEPLLRIVNPGPMSVVLGQGNHIYCQVENLKGKVKFAVERPEYLNVSRTGGCWGLKCGPTKVTASLNGYSDSIEVYVLDPNVSQHGFGFCLPDGVDAIHAGDRIELRPVMQDYPYLYLKEYITPMLLSDPSIAYFEGNVLIAKKPGEVCYVSQLLNWTSKPVYLTVLP